MEKCYFSRKFEIANLFGCVVWTILCLAFFAIAFWIFTAEDGTPPGDNLLAGSLFIGLGVAVAIWAVRFTIWMIRQYELDEAGIWVRYTARRKDFFPWSSVCQVCLCRAHHGKEESVLDDVIWCAIGTCPADRPRNRRCCVVCRLNPTDPCPPNTPWYRDLFEYEFCRSRSVLTIEFTPERLEQFKKYYKKGIPDFRSRNCY